MRTMKSFVSVRRLVLAVGVMLLCITQIAPGVGAGVRSPGGQLWAERYNGPGNGDDYASSIAVSPDGRTVFVTGGPGGYVVPSADYETVAYSAVTGAERWVSRYNGPAGGSDSAHSVAVSPDGRLVFVTGSSQGRAGR